MAHLAILQPDTRVAARLITALGGEHHVEVRASWPELDRLLAGSGWDGCVLDADHPDRERAVERIRRLRARHPRLAIVAYATFADPVLEPFAFGELGVDGVLAHGAEVRSDEGRTTIESALDLADAFALRAFLEPRTGPAGARAAAWAVEHARTAPGPPDLARAMGWGRARLARELEAAALPRPGQLLRWGRLLVAAAHLARDGRTVEATAFALRYASAAALGRAMKRETGLTPSQVAVDGGALAVRAVLFGTEGRGLGLERHEPGRDGR